MRPWARVPARRPAEARRRRVLLAGLAVLARPMPAAAQPPIILVVPFPAGGPTDRIARELAAALGRRLGQVVVTENRPGAAGSLAARRVAAARKDGHTLLLHDMTLAAAASVQPAWGFDALEALAPIGRVVDVPLLIVGRRGLVAADLAALLTHIRRNPGRIYLGHGAAGSPSHLCALLLRSAVGTPMVRVAYRSSAPALADLIGGQIDLVCDEPTSTLAQNKAGPVRVYAITTPAGTGPFEGWPTAREQGLPDLQLANWHGLYAPRGIPPSVMHPLLAALQGVVRDASFRSSMSAIGAQPVADEDVSPASLRTKLAAETLRWAEVLRRSRRRHD